MAFHVGQKVVLVGWGPGHIIAAWQAAGAHYPNVGDVYTVRAIKPWKRSAVLLLNEVDNSHLANPLEPGFRQEYFRPAVEPKADISFAHEILRKAKAPARTLAFASPQSNSGAE